MKKLKNILVIIGLVVILFGINITIIPAIHNSLDKNNNKEVKDKTIFSQDAGNEINKTTTSKKNRTTTKQTVNKTTKSKTTTTSKPKNKTTKSTTKKTTKKSTAKTTTKKSTTTSKKTSKPVSNSSTTKPNNKTDENTSETETKPIVPPVEEDKNNTKRKSMENTYGIKILYDSEIGDYKPKGVTPIKLTDSSEIEKYLNKLNTELAKYPKGFFKDFNKKGMPLTIYLIKSANGSFSGFTDYQFMNDIKMTLATDYSFEYTIHHEIMHYIDCYLDIVMYPNNPYDEYKSLNPNGFVYGNATSKQIYNMASNQRGAYFISSYGATHVKEDRAEVFKYMMARAYKPVGCFDENEIIRKKAEIISRQIKTYFPSVTKESHWDRFIK